MTREEAKQVLIVKAGYGDFVENIIDQIFNDHEVQLTAKDKEIERLKVELIEAIAELEEAIKPKTCNECEWWDFNSYGIFKKCFNGKGNCVSTKSSFGCNRFKQKDNK